MATSSKGVGETHFQPQPSAEGKEERKVDPELVRGLMQMVTEADKKLQEATQEIDQQLRLQTSQLEEAERRETIQQGRVRDLTSQLEASSDRLREVTGRAETLESRQEGLYGAVVGFGGGGCLDLVLKEGFGWNTLGNMAKLAGFAFGLLSLLTTK